MKGHIQKRGENSWRLTVFVGIDEATGKRRYAQKTVRGTKREAQTTLARFVTEVSSGLHTAPGSITLDELLTRWRELKVHQVSATTLEGYDFIIKRYIRDPLGRVRIDKLRAADLDRFYGQLLETGGHDGKPLSARTVRLAHVVLRQALAQARKWGMVVVNVAEDATPPRTRHTEIHPPSGDEVARILCAAMDYDPDFGVLLRLLAATGCRRGEALALRWRDIVLDTERGSGEILFSRSMASTAKGVLEKDTKTHQSRRVAIDVGTAAVLRDHRTRWEERAGEAAAKITDDSLLFSSSVDASTPWRPDVATNRFIRLCQDLGIEGVRLHDLRHYVATSLGAAGTPIATISTRLGHRDRATTLNVYSHSLPALDQQAADVIGGLLDESANINGRSDETAVR